MGEIADSLINGEFDAQTGEYIGEPCGYPRTYEKGYYNTINHKNKYFKSSKAIYKELSILIKSNIKDKIPNAVEKSKQLINLKYGKGWRKH